MEYSKLIVYGSIAGITIYNAKNNPQILKAWVYTFAPYTLRYIYNKILKKYPITNNTKITPYIETCIIGITAYSLYKSSNIFQEVLNTSNSCNFINYMSYNIIKTMSSLQYYRLLFFISGTGITYILSKYIQYRMNALIPTFIVEFVNIYRQTTNNIIYLLTDLINAMNNNQNYDVRINDFSIRGTTQLTLNTISEDDLERIAPLRFPNKDVSSIEYFNTDKCSICLETFAENMMHRILPCHHAFHAHCIDQWLLTRCLMCPLCKHHL